MQKRLISACFLAVCVTFVGSAAAQEVVHALSGTVVSVNPQAKTMVINTDDGSGGQFALASQIGNSLDFNKTIKDEVKPAATFDKTNAQVVVFFYGNTTVRTAVAVRALGPGPFVKTQGTVVKVNRHDHTLTMKDESGKSVTLQVSPNAVADTPDGVVQGDRFDPDKGDTIDVLATKAKGTEVALFVHE